MTTATATTADTLPRWANDILSSPPQRGGGLNRWLLRAAIVLLRCGRSPAETREELRIITSGEPIKAGEIERAVERAPEYIDSATPRPSSRRFPQPSMTARQRVIAAADGFGGADLWERSPYRFDDDTPHPEAIIDCLFPADCLLCAAGALELAQTAPRESFRGRLGLAQFVVPSPMSALTGLKQDGHVSPRCLDNTGPRRYLVVEQDDGTADEQAAVIAHLADRAPLALVVQSGGKSLHAWFSCADTADETIRRFFAYAVELGADPATWTPCQLVRMPDGMRRRPDGSTVRQFVLYFNPSVGTAR